MSIIMMMMMSRTMSMMMTWMMIMPMLMNIVIIMMTMTKMMMMIMINCIVKKTDSEYHQRPAILTESQYQIEPHHRQRVSEILQVRRRL